jgi:hypothetical protein
MKADVQAYKPADFYAVYIGFRCAYDIKRPSALKVEHRAR